MQLSEHIVGDVPFFLAQTAVGPSTPFPAGGYKVLTIEIWGNIGTGTPSRTIVFEAQGPSGAWYPVNGIQQTTNLAATQTTNLGEMWQFDISGFVQFRLNLTTLVGVGASINAAGKVLPI